jgi:hypothetical protein
MKFRFVFLMIAAVILSLGLEAVPESRPLRVKNNFPKVSADAVKVLKISRGKAFNSGAVFVDGKFIPPPYVVERYGTYLRINRIQVTSQVIAWDEFLKTQSGVEKITVDPGTLTAKEEPLIEEEPIKDEPEEEEDDVEVDISSDDDLDDLFDDGDNLPKKKTKTVKKKQSYKRTVKTPPPPVAKVEYRLSGDFVMNEKSSQYLKKINEYRTRIDAHLRSGGYIFFSSKDQIYTGEYKTMVDLVGVLPNVMKNAASEDDFINKARANGIRYLPESVLALLYKNRLDCFQISSWHKRIQEEKEWKKVLNQM